MIRVTDDHDVDTFCAFALHDLVDLKDKRTGDVYITEAVFFDLVVDFTAYAVGTDHNCAAFKSGKILLADYGNSSFFQI